MNGVYQKTLANPISFTGIGLHYGLISNIKLLPSRNNTGIIFKRVDLKDNNKIEANFENVTSAKLSTTIQNSASVSVSTIEHLLAALYITGIDNLIIEIDNIEVPIMDGSSKEFVEQILKSGTIELTAKRKFLKITDQIEINEDSKSISIEPSNSGLEVEFELNYKNKIIGNQKNYINFSIDNLKDVYTSRTFCLFEDIEKIKKIGLAKGGSLQNAIVVKGETLLNESGLRNKNEFVNHKILDLAGDFLLSGYRIIGLVKCAKGGHSLSNQFIKEIFKSKGSFLEINLDKVDLIEKNVSQSYNKIAVNA